MKNKLVAIMLLVMVSISALAVPTYAAEIYYPYGSLTLDDGGILAVPYAAVSKEFVVVKFDSEDMLGFDRHAYLIYSFDSPAYEGEYVSYDLYKTDAYRSNILALDNGAWSMQSCLDTLDIDGLSAYTIKYSTFDYNDGDGNLIYPASVTSDLGGDYTDPDLNTSLHVVPIQDYSGIFPDVGSVIGDKRYDNWIILRERTTYTADNLIENDDGTIDYPEDCRWFYYLYFFSDDYRFVMESSTTATESNAGNPNLRLKASTVYRYVLKSDTFENTYISDSVLKASAGNNYWDYNDTFNDDVKLNRSAARSELTPTSNFSEFLNNIFVGSSMTVSVAQSGEWGSDLYGWYSCPAFYWTKTVYSDSDGGNDGSDNITDGESVSWLKKIYNAIVDGFNQVINKIGGGNNASSDVVDKPITDDDNGFSLGNILSDIFGFIGDILGGLWRLIVDWFSGITDAIGGFFDLIGDKTSDLFSFFGSDENDSSYNGTGSFFNFMLSLWYVVPEPIVALIRFGFGALILMAVLKMFH